ncbi:MAG: response regulator [Deltaproteobacteria bacterium]|nr:MAG: response regulator [Deltaproteobacteria bacterium]
MAFNILIVDDSSSIRRLLRKIIELSGLEVDRIHEASDGLEALKVLEREWVDFIMCDIHMPQMDGIEFLRKLREDEVLGRIPVIMISTEGREEIIQEARKLGVKAYVKKPFTPEEIRDVIEKFVGEEFSRDAGPH